MASYIPGRSIEEVQKEFGAKRWVKLASNENLLGPSPKAMAAIRRNFLPFILYPEGPCTVLRQALAERFSVSEKRVVISNGADNLLSMIANAFVNEGDEVVMSTPTFPVYTNVTQMMGGKPVNVKLKDFTYDLEAMFRKSESEDETGLYLQSQQSHRHNDLTDKRSTPFFPNFPDRVIVVLDEAYGDFVEDPSYPNGLDYLKQERPVLLLRTFSKVYGLAGLRIGFAIGREDLVDCLYQVREPFPVHRLAQVAAVAALNDEDHAIKSIRLVYEGRRYLYRELDRMGLSYVPSQANFIFIDFGRDSEEVFQALLKEGDDHSSGKYLGLRHFCQSHHWKDGG